MSSLRDALSEALSKSEAGTLETVTQAPVDTFDATTGEDVTHETAEAKADRARDEAGRFAPKPAEATEAPAPIEPRKPPSSWKKDYWDHWGKLDPNIQGYIEQRENEAAKGVSTYKQQFESVAPIQKALEPFIPSLQQRGLTPDRWLQDLGQVDRILSSGSPQEKAQLIHRMAAANGVQLMPQQGQPDPQAQYLMQTLNGLQAEMQSFKSLAAQQEQAALTAQINSFAADKPHFEKVRPLMGQLLQGGMADSLETAYEKAIWMSDEVRPELVAQQAAPVNRQAEIARKKTAASSPRSASPTGALLEGNGKKDVRSVLSEAFDNVTSGRV